MQSRVYETRILQQWESFWRCETVTHEIAHPVYALVGHIKAIRLEISTLNCKWFYTDESTQHGSRGKLGEKFKMCLNTVFVIFRQQALKIHLYVPCRTRSNQIQVLTAFRFAVSLRVPFIFIYLNHSIINRFVFQRNSFISVSLSNSFIYGCRRVFYVLFSL